MRLNNFFLMFFFISSVIINYVDQISEDYTNVVCELYWQKNKFCSISRNVFICHYNLLFKMYVQRKILPEIQK